MTSEELAAVQRILELGTQLNAAIEEARALGLEVEARVIETGHRTWLSFASGKHPPPREFQEEPPR